MAAKRSAATKKTTKKTRKKAPVRRKRAQAVEAEETIGDMPWPKETLSPAEAADWLEHISGDWPTLSTIAQEDGDEETRRAAEEFGWGAQYMVRACACALRKGRTIRVHSDFGRPGSLVNAARLLALATTPERIQHVNETTLDCADALQALAQGLVRELTKREGEEKAESEAKREAQEAARESIARALIEASGSTVEALHTFGKVSGLHDRAVDKAGRALAAAML